MAIANRDLDNTQKNYVLTGAANAAAGLVTGSTIYVAPVPSPGQLLEFKVAAAGISGSPVYTPQIIRAVGTGVTVISPGSAVTITANYGLSGAVMSGVTYNPSSSLAAVQAGDLLVVLASGSNTAALGLLTGFVIQATQDYKKSFDIG